MTHIFISFLSLVWIASMSLSAEAESTSRMRREVHHAMDKVEAGIKDLEAKSKSTSEKARVEWDKAVADLKKNRDKLKKEISESGHSKKEEAKDYWQRIKASLAELEKGIESAGHK